MRRFIKNTGIFFLILLTLGGVVEWLARSVPNDYRYKCDYLDHHAAAVEVLVLGGSQGLFGVDPALLHAPAFNACHISQSINFDYEILKKYAPRLTHLQTIVVTMSYPTLGGRIEHSIESWRVKNYNLYYGIKAYSRAVDYTELLSHRFQDNITLITDYYYRHRSNIHCSPMGWGMNYNSTRLDTVSLRASGRTAAMKHNVVATQFVRANLAIIDSILAIADRKHCRVVFYTPPTYRSYRAAIRGEVFRSMTDTLERIVSVHSNCLYYNMFDSPLFGASDFFDGDHLNHAGARKLSQALDSLMGSGSGGPR